MTWKTHGSPVFLRQLARCQTAYSGGPPSTVDDLRGFSKLVSRFEIGLAGNTFDVSPTRAADGDVHLSFSRDAVLANSTIDVTVDAPERIAVTHPARHCTSRVGIEPGADCRTLANRLIVNGEVQPTNCPVLHTGEAGCLAGGGVTGPRRSHRAER